MEGEDLYCDEDRWVRENFSVQWLRWEMHPWRTAEGAIGGIVIFTEDITQQKKDKEQLQLAASVFTNAREGIVICDPQGAILDVNEMFTKITGYSRAEVLGRNPRLLKSGRQSEEFYADMWRSLTENGQWSGEVWNKAKDGTVYPETLTINAVYDRTSKVRHYVGAVFRYFGSQGAGTATGAHGAFRCADQPAQSSPADRSSAAGYGADAPARAGAGGGVHRSGRVSLRERRPWPGCRGPSADGSSALHEAGSAGRRHHGPHRRRRICCRAAGFAENRGGDPDSWKPCWHAGPRQSRWANTAFTFRRASAWCFTPRPRKSMQTICCGRPDRRCTSRKLAGKNRYQIFDPAHDITIRTYHEDLEQIQRALAARRVCAALSAPGSHEHRSTHERRGPDSLESPHTGVVAARSVFAGD